MPTPPASLDALCAGLLASFERANGLLAQMPLPGEGVSGSMAGRDPARAPLPLQLFFSRRRLALQSAELVLPCYVDRKNAATAAILSTRPPSWWRRARGTHAALLLHLSAAQQQCVVRFLAPAADTNVAAPSRSAWQLALNPQQQAQLAALALPPLARWPRVALAARMQQWWRQRSGNATR
jgi:hypothetical protein